MRFLFRLLSMFALSVAVIMAVVDATRTIAADEWTFTPLGESWRAVAPESLERLTGALSEGALSALWDPAMTFLLSLPGWLVFGVLALVLQAAGRPRRVLSAI